MFVAFLSWFEKILKLWTVVNSPISNNKTTFRTRLLCILYIFTNILTKIKNFYTYLFIYQASTNCGPQSNCGLRARNSFKRNAARKRKFCGPRAWKCGPQRKIILSYFILLLIWFNFINFVSSSCIILKKIKNFTVLA